MSVLYIVGLDKLFNLGKRYLCNWSRYKYCLERLKSMIEKGGCCCYCVLW